MALPRQLVGVRRAALGEIAALRSGFVPSATAARERKRHEHDGRLRPAGGPVGSIPKLALGLQPSAIQPDGTINWKDVIALLPVRDAERYVIHEGDLLLPLRSQRTQTVVARGVPHGVLASGHWALIAPTLQEADAEYLAWYLNHPHTRARLAGTMMGTSLQFLTVGAVRNFQVELPDLATQRRISTVAALTARVGQLERRLASERQQLADALGMSALHAVGGPSRQVRNLSHTLPHR